MKRHALFFLALCCLPFAAASAEPAARPNVVLFLTDDQGYGDLGYHDNPHAKTPQMDAFAREAVEMSNFHVSPVCSPTRASLMTGRYNFRTGVCDVFRKATLMDPAEVTVAEALRGAGYATGIFGKWHLGDDAERNPNAQGFDEALSFPGAAMRQYFDPELVHNGAKGKRRGYCMDIFTDAAIGFIQKNRAKPFFVYLPANLIHTPLQVEEALAAPYAALGPSTSKTYGMLQSVDNNFGRLRATLKDLGLEENTLLLFTADNGPCSGSAPTNRFMAGLHGLKGTVYENGIRVPCFARWPAGFKGPAKVARLTAHVDVMPTILEACGVAAPAGVKLDGRSFLPLLRDPAAPWPDRALFFQWDSGQEPRRGHAWCAVTERWKLVQPAGMDAPNQQHIRDRYAELCRLQGRGERSIEGAPRHELYDLAADPGETKDLAAQQPAVVGSMKKQYEAWFDDVAARWQAARGQPNIIFILADDLGWGDIGPFGQKKIQTPSLDRMAAEGMKFTAAYCGTSVCAPSRCSLMTGLHMGHAPVRANREIKPEGQMPLPKGTVTVAQLLQRAGYKTALCGKWGLGFPGSGSEPTKMGFDFFFGYNCQRHAHGYYPAYLWRNDERVPLDGKTYSHDLIAREALGWVRQNHASPFFLYFAATIPHGKWEVPDQGPYAALDWPDVEKNFASMITRLDRDVGRLFALLKELGIDERTLVFFTSDNGACEDAGQHKTEFFDSNGPWRGAKRGMYEGSLRVPMLARWPGTIQAGAVNDDPWAFWDFLPTAVELAGAKLPADFHTDGLSVAAALRGGPMPKRDGFYWELHEGPMKQAVRFGDWKAVRNGINRPVELYDLKSDPGETTDLAARQPDVLARAESLLKCSRVDSPDWPPKPVPAAGKGGGKGRKRSKKQKVFAGRHTGTR